MKIYVDIDDTICRYDSNEPSGVSRNYNNAIPVPSKIKTINNVDKMPIMLIKEKPIESRLESISLKRTTSPAKDPNPQKRIVPGIIAKRPYI